MSDALAQLKEQYGAKLADPTWRLCSGELYKIIIKGDKPDDDLVIPFKPNRAQRRFIERLHHRNLILKARQRGFTTLIAIAWLDHALWVANSRCGIVAHDLGAAEVIFRDKVKFAYDNLPALFKMTFPLARDSTSELLFGHNNSSVRVATSMRSGTIHRLHVSEFGKICAKFPDRAKEVVTGSFPSVPSSGVIVIESTAEGQEGEFFEMTQRAIALFEQGKPLNAKDWRFHFFPWWLDSPDYELDPAGILITDKDNKYFDQIGAECGTTITLRQRAWYVATRDADYPNNPERMWQEYPSTYKEAFQQSTEGLYYAQQLTDTRKDGRICLIPKLDLPVETFWDIGNSDMTAIWFMQKVGMEHRFIKYYENSGETLGHYVKYLQDTGFIFGKHYLPHDAAHKRLSDHNKSVQEMLEAAGMRNIEIVPRITDELTGIQMTRNAFRQCVFDERDCSQGLIRLGNFRKAWNAQTGAWKPTPRPNDENAHGADAFRQFAQALDGGMMRSLVRATPRRQSGGWRTL